MEPAGAGQPRALISIGTNSTRLLILAHEAVVVARSTGTRLGRGLGADGQLDHDARTRTLAVVAEYTAEISARRAAVDVVATSALRRASDAGAFANDVAAIVGVAPRILSGDEEAAYSFAGATWGIAAADRLGVLDVGGGSTELAVGTQASAERTLSIEIGAVRLAERHPALLGAAALDAAGRAIVVDRVRADVGAVLAPLAALGSFDELLAVGGTVFTAAGMVSGDPTRDGVRIDRAQRRGLIDELLARDLVARRALAHIRPQRADILPAGLFIVDVACDILGIDALRVSHADLLAGYLRSPAYRGRIPSATSAANQ
jgi:exopolyphosphatase/guanosine-5'-triphosphate,3'-diphosphate pyrophosphatase